MDLRATESLSEDNDEHTRRSFQSRPTPLNLADFIPYACFQLEAPFKIKMKTETQGEYHGSDEKSKKSRRRSTAAAYHVVSTPLPQSNMQQQESELLSPDYDDGTTEIVITVVMDVHGHLVELIFNRCIQIPHMLIKVIGFCVPFHQYLNKLTIRWGPLTSQGLYEFSKFLFISQLSEICLDDSPVAGRNYEVLLERPSNLRCLSLARCKLDDMDCIKLASMLAHPRPASKHLNVLSLVSNMIGDKGACAFGNILRNNRNLHYLNLAGNRITDIGAASIFNSLMEFLVLYDEIYDKKTRRIEYLKLWNEVYPRYVKELNQDRNQEEMLRSSRRKTAMKAQRKLSIHTGLHSVDAVYQKAHAMTVQSIGAFIDPFTSDQMRLRNGLPYCIGNLTLCCLNLSHNNLEFASLVSLYDILMYQSSLQLRGAPGLLHVIIDGNNLPSYCDELSLIEELLERAQTLRSRSGRRMSEKLKRKTSKGSTVS